MSPYTRCIVFSGGKTGSETLFYSLVAFFPDMWIEHRHMLSRAQVVVNGPNGPLSPNDLKVGRTLIINSWRACVPRHVSSFFQNLSVYAPDVSDATSQDLTTLTELFHEALMDYGCFEDYHPLVSARHHLEPVIPRDLRIPPDRTHEFIRVSPHLDVLLLKFSCISTWDLVLRRVLGREDFVLGSFNRTQDKPYGRLYRAMLDAGITHPLLEYAQDAQRRLFVGYEDDK